MGVWFVLCIVKTHKHSVCMRVTKEAFEMGQFFRDERGTAAIEYSLLITLIGLVLAGGLHVVGLKLLDAFSSVEGGLTSVQVIESKRKASF